MAQYTPNFNLYEPDTTDDFADFRTEFNNNMNIIDQNLGGGGGSGGHTIYDKDGNALAQESGLQFTGSVNVTDDSVNGRTVVDISGGNNLILDAQIYSTEEKQVGVWTNKKPLYQRTVEISSVSYDGNWHNVAHGISNVETIVQIKGIIKTTSNYFYDCDVARPNTNLGVIIEVASSNISYMNTYVDNPDKLWVTLLYTKTTDVAGSGGYEAYGFSPVIYSDVERKIGVWRDNKPLYQKTIYTNNATVNNEVAISVSSLNIDSIVDIKGTYDRIVNWLSPPLHMVYCFDVYEGNDEQSFIRYDVDDENIKYRIKLANNEATSYQAITIQYTKTTDVAGSGDYNTYGVPTVHYSTSEQVIGTWINGKPLYEITVEVNSVAYNDWTDVFYLADADIKGYDSRTSYAQLNNGERVQLDWFVTTAIYNRSIITNSGTKFRVETQGNNYSKIVATIQYTKTTD